ncbi:hypothetical protein TNCV_46141, partial [Trichonephila clavipes]
MDDHSATTATPYSIDECRRAFSASTSEATVSL